MPCVEKGDLLIAYVFPSAPIVWSTVPLARKLFPYFQFRPFVRFEALHSLMRMIVASESKHPAHTALSKQYTQKSGVFWCYLRW
jgi:hypothetical protein